MTENITLSTALQLSENQASKNRLFKSAMSEQLACTHHQPTTGLIELYKVWAQGGTGLLVTGNVMIDRNAIGEPRNVVLDKQSDAAMFKQWAEAGSANDTQLWMQLNHPGKQIPNMLCKEPVAPSAIPLTKGLEKTFNCPRALTELEIEDIISRFAYCAAKAKEWGFAGVQIHSAHGYLCNQFLSPHHNRREDKWGGSLDNRMRFLREVYAAVRNNVGDDFPIGVKINSADFQQGGFTEQEALTVIETLESDGMNLIEISGGNYENPSMVGENVKESTLKREAYFLEFSEKLQSVLNIPLVVTGGFRSAPAMNAALQSGATDMIGLARPLAVDPTFSNKLISDDNHSITWAEPSTGIKALDVMAMLSITWYESQLARIANGKGPDPKLSAWRSVFKTLGLLASKGLQKRRA